MSGKPEPIPAGYHSIIPHLTVKNAAEAIEFYKKAFRATEISRMPAPGSGLILHADIKIGDSHVFLNDEFPGMCASPQGGESSPFTVNIYTDDIDALWQQAVDAGAQITLPLDDAFWGDRYGRLVDPYGHHWAMVMHVRDLTPEQIAQNAAQCFGSGPAEN